MKYHNLIKAHQSCSFDIMYKKQKTLLLKSQGERSSI
jgi:hypothetical protein